MRYLLLLVVMFFVGSSAYAAMPESWSVCVGMRTASSSDLACLNQDDDAQDICLAVQTAKNPNNICSTLPDKAYEFCLGVQVANDPRTSCATLSDRPYDICLAVQAAQNADVSGLDFKGEMKEIYEGVLTEQSSLSCH